MVRDGNRWLFYCGSADEKHRRRNDTSALNIIWADGPTSGTTS